MVSCIDDKAEKEYLNAAEEEEGNHPVLWGVNCKP